MYKLWIPRFFILSLCITSGQFALSDEPKNSESNNTIIGCTDPSTGSYYLTNIKGDMPKDCQNIKTIPMPVYQPSNQDNTGLRETEKAQLQAIEQSEQTAAKKVANNQTDEKIGLGLYGSWQDNRQDKCFAYRARVEEAYADRKDDVRLNRQAERDLKQIDYYCR